MKRIIGGKRYDSETAERMIELSCSVPPGEWQWHLTELFRTRNGNYFLAGWGMGGSMWGQKLWDCNDRVKGEGLRVVSSEEARTILESEGALDLLEEYFEVIDA